MYKKILLIACISLYSTFAIAKAERVKTEEILDNNDIESAKTIMNTLRIIKEEYVNPISDNKLVEYAINGMLSSLDPHSTYLNKEEASELAMHSSGEFEGIGIEVTSDNGLIRVVAPIDGGPAYNAGIKSGDYIISINDESTYGLSTYDIVQKIRGKPNTPITLTILREDNPTPTEYKLHREKVTIHSVNTSIIETDLLYIRISYFYGNTDKLLEEAIKKASNNTSLKGIILDLRNNPGGFLEQSVKVASMFIDKGNVVYTKGKKDMNAVNYPVDKKIFKVKNVPIVVLINNGTASAAEIVAGALQDHKKAAILGTKSFGKGSVQTVIDLDKDKAISLTTALYYTPSGKSIQLEGVIPDIAIEDVEIKKYRADHGFREENIKGHLSQAINIKRNDKDNKTSIIDRIKKKIIVTNQNTDNKDPLYKGDLMVLRAVDLLKGINIYNYNTNALNDRNNE